ncbi:stage II sporulation protein P [Acetivibrio mesophilus]|uniref:Stage II sporulation protein P n=1 Tax=Acetivibrio mesophilus TaxID=2487273 RepID=A0A4V1K1T1_9FIRM|nr:stage II sporulation protein P [Acetivibrio mesophilus]RXE57869.1 stage II sporulation protein P [Acetivibrio mesophilus]
MKGYGLRKRKFDFSKLLKIALVVILSIGAIKIGIIAGDTLYRSDKKIIGKIDVETFRSTLNVSMPIIDTIYNSGNISFSISGQIKEIINTVFYFDLSNPVTIMSAQSPIFYSYYTGEYQRQLAKNQNSEPYFYVAELETPEDKGANKKDLGSSVPEPTYPASSITYNINELDRKSAPESTTTVTAEKIAINSHDIDYEIDIDKLLNEPLNINFDKKGPKVLIYHTHTTEGFIKELSELDKSGIPSRTTDNRYNVVRVGEELAQTLRKKYGIEVIHNATVHNQPSDTGAYGRSLNTANNILKSYPSIKVVLDIHRDGLDDKKLRVATRVNDKDVAKIMFVVGTDATGLEHPNWRENLKFAIKLQQKLNEKYPGITRPIYMSRYRYNQHLSNNSLIVEIGGDGNTINECLESSKYFAEALNEVINNK